MAGKIGILAGGGDLPLTVAARLQGEGRPFHVIRLAEFADDRLARYPNDVLPMGAFGGVQKALKRAGCDTICLAGHVARPDFRFLAKDLKAISVVPSLVAAATRGDDALLRAVIKVFEDEGFGVVGADQLLGGETLPAGALGRIAPDAEALADLRKALSVARATGDLDIGQGAVVCRGLVLAVEAAEGTDAMLTRVAGLPEALRGTAKELKGALGKAPKPIQDTRVDMPVMGVRTIELAHAAGLAGVAGVAGQLILMDRSAMIAAADRLGLFVWGEEG